MNIEEYNKLKEDIIKEHGVPVFDLRDAVNQSAKLIRALEIRKRQETRIANKQQNDVKQPEDVFAEDKAWKRPKYTKLPSIIVLDKDLKGFTAIEAEIVKQHYLDRSLSVQALAHQFNKPYQTIAGLFRRAEFKALELKYFLDELGGATQTAILQMIKNGNPNVVQHAAEYLGVMKDKENTTDENRLVNPLHEEYLRRLSEWLMDDTSNELVLTKIINTSK